MKIIGVGNTAEVFEYDEGKVCKLFFEGYPREYVELEYRNAKEMYTIGITVPKPFEIVVTGNRNGIIYEKVDGKTLLNHMIDEKEHVDDFLEELVRLHKQMLEHSSKNILSYKNFLRAMLEGKKVEDVRLFEKIQMLPEGDAVLHGDFHPNNVLITKEGKAFIIDFMNVCHGPALYDVARTFFLIRGSSADMADAYLRKMNIEKKDIEQYLEIIEQCRKYE